MFLLWLFLFLFVSDSLADQPKAEGTFPVSN